jgi:hypothetical protein
MLCILNTIHRCYWSFEVIAVAPGLLLKALGLECRGVCFNMRHLVMCSTTTLSSSSCRLDVGSEGASLHATMNIEKTTQTLLLLPAVRIL